MIHTIEMILSIDYETIKRLLKKHNVQSDAYHHFGAVVKKLNENLKQSHSEFVFTWLCSQGKGVWDAHLKVDLVKLLGKGKIVEADYLTVESSIKKFLYSQFGSTEYFNNHRLTRIDYKLDVVIPNKDHRKLLFHLYEKYTRIYFYKKKIKWGKDEEGNPMKYETSQYHKCQSTEFVIYSKEDERMAKREIVQPYEKDVIRYELRLKNEHLNSMKRNDSKGKGRPKKLKEYFKENLYKHYMINQITPIIRKGDYYKIHQAEKIIENSPLSRKRKEKLRAFLVDISNNGIDAPKKYLSKPTYRNYLKELEQLNINPILIPKNRKDFPSHMNNPFIIQ
ncbi:hypothetical protein [Bacillus sp. CGMCC 1.16541]|uniref:hypothetical protein n=1 Tax=Bacillus sp. CGMCC 1.16541 TaxID=2185143 RepID=UPI000D733C53|nr:hypothetical protein [Bacillus sp. CGMCC 1.16541]